MLQMYLSFAGHDHYCKCGISQTTESVKWKTKIKKMPECYSETVLI